MMQTKRKQMLLQLYDHTGFERKLEAMALQGWKLEQCGTFLGWKFRRIEPTALRYKVVYFPEASEYDPEPGDKQAEFMELCDRSGWEYIDHSAQMLIFCTAYPYATPIETDAMLQVETVHKAMKKSFLPGQIGLLVLAFLELVLLGYRLHREFLNVMTFDGLLVAFAAYIIMGLMCAYHLGSYFLWRRKALAAAEDGDFVETRGNNWFEKLCLIILTVIFGAWMMSISHDAYLVRVAFVTFGVILGMLLFVNGGKLLMQKLGYDADTNRTVSILLVVVGTIGMILILFHFITDINYDDGNEKPYADTYEYAGRTHYIYDDPIPLTLEDLGISADYEHRSRAEDVTKSMLITVYNGQEIAPWGTPVENPPELYYTVTIPRFEGMVEPCAEDILDDKRILNLYGIPEACDPTVWEAEAAYLSAGGNGDVAYFTLIYADRVVEIAFPEMPTAEQIKIAVDALKTYEPK